jgi:glycosyltransferase involved in cell wall biosynthesis
MTSHRRDSSLQCFRAAISDMSAKQLGDRDAQTAINALALSRPPQRTHAEVTAATRIALVMSGFGQGGVPAMMLVLARALMAQGHPVDLVVARNEGPRSGSIPQGARVIDLEALHPRFSWRRLLRKKSHRVLACAAPLAAYFEAERPGIVFSGGNYINYVCLRARSRSTVKPGIVVSHRSHFSHESRGRVFARRAIRRAYPDADAIVAVSDGVADDLAAGAGLARERITTIYNPAVTPEVIANSRQPASHEWLAGNGPPVVVAAGRLHRQKDFPTLIRAFAQLRARRQARLVIFGEGAERSALEHLVTRLDLSKDVDLPGFVENPHACMARAGVFVLSSAWEGFSNVVAEALACGCPVVATNCPSGPAEILGNGQYGRLVPVGDADAMAAAIAEALDDPGDPAARRARAAAFSVPAAVQHYLTLFDRVVEGANGVSAREARQVH